MKHGKTADEDARDLVRLSPTVALGQEKLEAELAEVCQMGLALSKT
jgi:hypothetical protein